MGILGCADDDVEADRWKPLLRRVWIWKARGVRRALRGRFGAVTTALLDSSAMLRGESK